MRCTICGIFIDLVSEEINNEGWVPFFYEGDAEHGPICSSCSEQFIHEAEDGEFELKKEYQGKMIYHEENRNVDHWISLELGFILN